jgi:hypothetical protein
VEPIHPLDLASGRSAPPESKRRETKFYAWVVMSCELRVTSSKERVGGTVARNFYPATL